MMTADAVNGRPKLPRWRPPAARKPASSPNQDEVAVLEIVAAELQKRIAEVLPGCSIAIQSLQRCEGPPRSETQNDTSDVTQLWRFQIGEVPLWCLVNGSSQRRLLSFVIGESAPTTPECTPRILSGVEKSIVAEAMRRILTLIPRASEFSEEPFAGPRTTAVKLEIILRGQVGEPAVLQFIVECKVEPAPLASPPSLRRVPVTLVASLPSFLARIADLRAWRPGDVVGLQAHAERCMVLIHVGSQFLASGQLGSLNSMRAVKLNVPDSPN